ncbi:MAG: protein disulfide isomerase (PDI) protein [Gomphillus americanus]|uniref:Mannitol-1-phosphate 5-dehydrogenase n=1 Tax=Gomphillus americanus TaxID=1940652 RepID=A0A8H3FGZ3_9LECA|nr:MAG: protein disulfide isomerase (PDI) protein [Gomphillus americanus]
MGGKAVHFGGGNIGRGFVAEKLSDGGNEVVFVDVMDSIIEQLQKHTSYTVTEIGDGEKKVNTITNYRAINSKHDEAKVVEEIATADIVTCAVGPNILKFIAPVIAKGIEKRTESKPLAVIACENAIGATDTLAGFIKGKLSEDGLKTIEEKVAFGNSAIDRIVPAQDADAGLNVTIEKFFEWCVESKPFEKFGRPSIKGVHWVEELSPYIERKLFTVNTSHATAAYFGYYKKVPFIHTALEDPEINAQVHAALAETANLITKKHGISEKEQKQYVETIISRISNPYLKDGVDRVGRAPLRKLSRKERFIGPAFELAEMGEPVDALMKSVEYAFLFQNVEGDEESKELAKIVAENEPEAIVEKVCGLKKEDKLFDKVLAVVKKVKGSA